MPESTITSGSDDSRVEDLVEQHRPWAEGIGRSMRKHVPAAFWDDLVPAALLGLVKAARAYNPALNDCFPAFAHVYVQGECWMLVRRRAYQESQHQPLPEQLAAPQAEDAHEAEISLQIAQLGDVLREGMTLLTRRQRAIIQRRYYREQSMKRVARKLDIGMTTAYTVQREALLKLRKHCEDRGVRVEDL